MIDLQAYKVELELYLDELDIKCHNLLNERLNPNNTREDWLRLNEKYEEADRKRNWVLFELQKLKEGE